MKKQRKGFTLIELLIVVVIVGILALAAIPLITANTRDARRSEGEQLLGSMKNRVKVAYTKTGALAAQLTGEMGGTTNGCGVQSSELVGKYFSVTDSVGGDLTAATLTTTAPSTAADGQGTLTFFVGGTGGSPAGDNVTWVSP